MWFNLIVCIWRCLIYLFTNLNIAADVVVEFEEIKTILFLVQSSDFYIALICNVFGINLIIKVCNK